MLVLLGMGAVPTVAQAATFTVTTAAATGPPCVVLSCTSLASAINAANANPDADTIEFSIASGQQTIVVFDPTTWPAITRPVTIDGTTQPGHVVNGPPIIKIIGCSDPVCTLTGTPAPGVHVASGGDGSVIKGLIVARFNQGGIVVEAPNTSVVGNYVGVDFNGVTPGIGNAASGGIRVAASNVTVGGTSAADRNVISDNHDACGVDIEAGAGSVLEGNYVGTSKTGLTGLANVQTCGVRIGGTATNTLIGGTAGGAGNVISGNDADGVQITGGTGTTLQGNRIGIGPDDSTVVANRQAGVRITGGTQTTVGGYTGSSASINVISGNDHTGIHIVGASAAVLQNFIGLDRSGTAIRANGDAGVRVEGGAGANIATNLVSGNTGPGLWLSGGVTGALVQNNVIGLGTNGPQRNTGDGVLLQGTGGGNLVGGTGAHELNAISGNDGAGVHLDGGADRVVANWIGLDADGTTPAGNGVGVLVTGEGGTVGGPGAGAGNLISGNNAEGVLLTSGAHGATVQGNQVGGDEAHGFTSPGGFTAANQGTQIKVSGTAAGNLIGGAGSGNDVIEVNGLTGAIRLNGSGAGNTVRANRIRLNGTAAGIDVGPLGITAALTPTFTSVLTSGPRTQLIGTFNGAPSTVYSLDIYGVTNPCDDDHRATSRYLGVVSAATGPDGSGAFNAPLDALPAVGERIVGTLTDPAGTTNELGPCAAAAQAAPTLEIAASDYHAGDSEGAVRVTVTRTGGGLGSAGVHLRTSDGTAHAGTDYTAVDAYLTVNADQASATYDIPVRLLAPRLLQGEARLADRAFTLTASDPNAAVLGTRNSTTITLSDDRLDPIVSTPPPAAKRPVVSISSPHRSVRASSLKSIRGKATSSPTKVQVAVIRTGGCRRLATSGRLRSRRRSGCAPLWLKAAGGATWTLRLRHRLPRGTYRVYARATNSAGTGDVVRVTVRVT